MPRSRHAQVFIRCVPFQQLAPLSLCDAEGRSERADAVSVGFQREAIKRASRGPGPCSAIKSRRVGASDVILLRTCPSSPTARPARSRAACLTVLLHILVLVAAVRCAVLMPTIDVIGKRHINTSKAEYLDALAQTVNLLAGTHAFQCPLSVPFQI